VERCSGLDEDRRIAHGPAGLQKWIDVIDEKHVACGWDAPSKSPEVLTVRDLLRAAMRKPTLLREPMASELLQRVLREVKPTFQGLRDRALVLLSALGPANSQDLASLTVDQVTFASGDGMLVSLESTGDVWVGSIDVPLLCAPCTLIEWLDLVTSRGVVGF
jgi:hypothetical protein